MLRRGDIVIGKLDDYYEVKILLLVELIYEDHWWVRNFGHATSNYSGFNKYTLTQWKVKGEYYKVPIEALHKERQNEIKTFMKEYMERDLV